MPAPANFAALADIQARHPTELAVLAADETTRVVDPVRAERALDDVSTEIRSILGSRYTFDELDRADDASRAVLQLFAIDMALYRVAYAPRVTEAIRDRYQVAVARLKDLAKGAGGLTIVSVGTGPELPGQPGQPAAGTGSPNEVLISANERLFTRRRYGGAA